MDDLISPNEVINRQAAIDALDAEYRCTDVVDDWDGLKTAIGIIACLPYTQLEVIYCKDCANRGRLGSCLVYWRNINGLTTVPWKPDDYDFCSKAVRRADE